MTHFLGALLAGVIRYAIFILEALAVFALIGIGRRNPCFGGGWFQKIESAFCLFARRRRLAIVTVGALPILIRVALVPLLPPRLPGIADEFSYVLAGDTFALGRVTNPPHPMRNYFDSPHILQQPTYMSMYFPAQGLFLAAGKRFLGGQYTGVWLSVGLMCAAICWMLQGWLPPPWALLGGLLAVMRLGLFGYWMNSYFGGAVPALGGALLLGAVPRLLRKQRTLDAVLFGLGLAILANSRPFEGAFLAAPAACFLIYAMGKLYARGERGPTLGVVLPLAGILSVAAAGTCYYNFRVTGSPLKMPEALRVEQTMVAPLFLWGSPRPEPLYYNAGTRAFHTGPEMQDFRATRTVTGWFLTVLLKVRDFWLFYLGPVLTLPLIMLPRVLKDRRTRLLVVAGILMLPAFLVNVWFYPHYAAPATALIYALLVQCIRHLRAGGYRGALLARGIPAICVLMLVLRLSAQPLAVYFPLDFPMTWFSTRPGGVYRAEILHQLHNEGGQHLILVRWKPGDNPFEQWVYNEPDIDRSAVVWAWEPDQSDELLRYFRGRRVWVLRVAWQGPPTLSAYDPTEPH